MLLKKFRPVTSGSDEPPILAREAIYSHHLMPRIRKLVYLRVLAHANFYSINARTRLLFPYCAEYCAVHL